MISESHLRPTRLIQQDGAIKFCLSAGHFASRELETESIIIPMRNYHGQRWYTLCISSQVGCRMGCTFCQTGRMGLLANLSADQIVIQFTTAQEILRRQADRSEAAEPGLRNVVFMGMGEPLDNFNAVVAAIRILNDPAGLNVPLSRITISTVGRVDGIRKLAELRWTSLRLAISLTAADDALRNELMPVNRAMPLAELKEALLDYPRTRRTRFFIEYVLLKDVNDSEHHADALAAWCESLPVRVNVIAYNPQQPAAYQTPDDQTIVAFILHLRQKGILAKRRVTIGRDVFGACGQLGNTEFHRKELLASGGAAASAAQ
ncbi:MAG TPA: 23S rRNA (adenine(2503)-C(2))-methyltransferase RlmN [Phycisphaerae bacterium]|nr:23S rRNA (adenine(2503)-C(2))-methyltransferase RlmN [Phycisphaerae bacterium]